MGRFSATSAPVTTTFRTTRALPASTTQSVRYPSRPELSPSFNTLGYSAKFGRQERAEVLDAEPEFFDCVMAKQRLATPPYHPPLVAPRSLPPQRFGRRVPR